MITPPEHLTLFSRRGLDTIVTRANFRPFRWASFSGLDTDTLDRSFQRYLLGGSRPARAVAKALATATEYPMRWVDRACLGTSFEMYATAQ